MRTLLLLLALLPVAAADPDVHGDCGESDVSTSSLVDSRVVADAWVKDCAGASLHQDGLVCRPPGVHVDRGAFHVFYGEGYGCPLGVLVELP